jgi:dihydropyrimidinase
MIDLVISGGLLATSEWIVEADIAVKDGKIHSLGAHGFVQNADKVIDAPGKIVIPGAIDPHVHMQSRAFGTITKDDFSSGSQAGAFGGVTSIIDFAIPRPTQSPLDAFQELRGVADGKSFLDYAIHGCLTNADEKTVAQVKQLIDLGAPSFKMFMTYRKEGILIDDGMLLTLISEIARNGGLPGVHAENDSMIVALVEKFIREGKISPQYHALSRPNITESEAINRVQYIAEFCNSPLYIYHMSTKEGADLIRKARRSGSKSYAEVCTHHLVLTDKLYERTDGIKFIMTPPLRRKEDTEALWAALADGTISNVASDHSSWDMSQKQGKKSFAEVPNGVAGIETRIPVTFSEGVSKERLSLQRFVEVVSTNPAKIFGLYPKKGSLSVGSDADITIIDPKLEAKITLERLHSKVDYTIYEGFKVKGYPIATVARGEVIVKEGQFATDSSANGLFLPRKKFSSPPV